MDCLVRREADRSISRRVAVVVADREDGTEQRRPGRWDKRDQRFHFLLTSSRITADCCTHHIVLAHRCYVCLAAEETRSAVDALSRPPLEQAHDEVSSSRFASDPLTTTSLRLADTPLSHPTTAFDRAVICEDGHE